MARSVPWRNWNEYFIWDSARVYMKYTKCVQTCAQGEPEIKGKAGPCGIHVFPVLHHSTCGAHVLFTTCRHHN